MSKSSPKQAAVAPAEKSAPPKSSEWLSTRETSVRLSCSLSKVQKMVEAGELAAWKTSGGHRRIPASEVERVLAQRPVGSFVGGTARQFRILIAEDNKALQKLYAAKLASWKLPIELLQVEDGYAALLMVAKHRPDLVIMDLLMPELDGAEAIRSIRADRDFDAIDIIVISAVAGSSVAAKVPADVSVFKKPIDFAQLHGFVQACISRRMPARPAPAQIIPDAAPAAPRRSTRAPTRAR